VIVFRIAKARHASDLSGAGARAHGGRWNEKGTPLLYTSTNRALATAEYLVHVDPLLQPRDLRMVSIELPDGATVKALRNADLPAAWNTYPAPAALAELGTKWAASRKSLALRVPSAVVAGEHNMLINPLHPEAAKVRVVDEQPYAFDPRLLGLRQ
jgi:RES domain-containing protein